MWRNLHATLAMQGNRAVRNAPNLNYSHAYENEFTFGHELNMDLNFFDLSKCNSNSNFNSIYGFRKFAKFNSNLICDCCTAVYDQSQQFCNRSSELRSRSLAY